MKTYARLDCYRRKEVSEFHRRAASRSSRSLIAELEAHSLRLLWIDAFEECLVLDRDVWNCKRRAPWRMSASISKTEKALAVRACKVADAEHQLRRLRPARGELAASMFMHRKLREQINRRKDEQT